ncbi:MAG: hypothetical protein ACFCU1_08140 [Sumerlaeia bacterium]
MKKPYFLTVLFFLIAAYLPASSLTVNVSDDSGGYYRPGSWFPIILSISNQPGGSGKDEAFFGRATVETSSYTSNQGAYQFSREISVPVSSQKRFVLYVKIPDRTTNQINVTIRRANNQLVQEFPLSIAPLKDQDVFTLLISSDLQRINLPMLRAASANTRKQSIRSPEYLPDHWAGYDAANLVIFPSWPTGSMTSKNIAALREWVVAGGTLVLLGGSETTSYQDEAAREFLPVSLNGTATVEYNSELRRFTRSPQLSDESFIISESTPLPGSAILAEGSGGLGAALPLAVVKEIGLGKVVFFAVDFKTNQKGIQEMFYPAWFAITPLESPVHWNKKFVEVVNDKLLYVTGRSARPPSAVLIILICILYTLVVGPINFFVLAKTQRIQWAWATVPIIVFLFSGLIYGLGTITKGGKTIARESSLYLGKGNSADFAVESFLGVLTPDATDLIIEPVVNDQTVSDHDRWYEESSLFGFTSQLADPGAITINADKPVIETTDEGVSVSKWPLRTFGFKRFSVRGTEVLPGSLDSTLRYGSNDSERSVWLEGQLTNHTGVNFTDSALFFGTRGLNLGEFAAEESRNLTKNETNFSVNGSQKSQWNVVLESSLKLADANENETSDSGINNFNALRLANGIYNQDKLASILPSTKGKLYFVGVAEADELSVNINLEADEGTRSKLFVIELNPLPLGKTFWVPEEFVHVALVNYEPLSNSGGDFGFASTNKGMALEMNQYTSVFVLELPFRGSGIQADAMINNMVSAHNPQNQVVSSLLLSVSGSGNPIEFKSNAPVFNRNAQWFTPYNGRGWLIYSSDLPRDESGKPKGEFSYGDGRITRVSNIGFSVTGRVE